MEDFRAVIKQWPNYAALASDVEVDYKAVAKWHDRNRIPPEYWIRLIASAKVRRYRGITAQKLAELSDNGQVRERTA